MGVAIKYINLIQFVEDMLLCLMTPKGKGKKKIEVQTNLN